MPNPPLTRHDLWLRGLFSAGVLLLYRPGMVRVTAAPSPGLRSVAAVA